MKIKHFAGYGCVNVKKQSKETFTNYYGEEKTKLVLVVKGNHEYGLVPYMAKHGYVDDVKRWIFDKFEKNFNGNEANIEMTYEEDYVNENGIDVDMVTYTFIY